MFLGRFKSVLTVKLQYLVCESVTEHNYENIIVQGAMETLKVFPFRLHRILKSWGLN